MTRLLQLVLAGTALASSGPAAEAACETGKTSAELTAAEARAIYDCLKDDLLAGYMQGEKRWIPAEYVASYRSWTLASAYPAAPGFHGERLLMTYVNEIGAGTYLQFRETDVTVPAGTVIAKESFAVDAQGKVQPGPLFLMEKVEAGRSPQTDDWFYMAVAPNGSPMAMDVISACSECHQQNFGHQGGLGYPVPEARVTR